MVTFVVDVLVDELEDKAEAPGETPDPHTTGLAGSRPLGLGIAVLPPLPPSDAQPLNNQFLPSSIAANKKKPPSLRLQPVPPPVLPTQIDPEVSGIWGGIWVVFSV